MYSIDRRDLNPFIIGANIFFLPLKFWYTMNLYPLYCMQYQQLCWTDKQIEFIWENDDHSYNHHRDPPHKSSKLEKYTLIISSPGLVWDYGLTYHAILNNDPRKRLEEYNVFCHL